MQGTQAISRAFRLVRLFDRQQTELSLSELAEQANLHPATAYRILQALTQEGMLTQNPDTKNYRLGLGLLKLGELAKQSNDLIRIAAPHVEKLATLWQETTILDTLDRNLQVMTALFIPSSYRVATNPSYDKPVPPHCISSGKVLLASLPVHQLDEYLTRDLQAVTEKTMTNRQRLKDELANVRRLGYATNFEEQELGFNAIGAPILDFSERVIAAVSIGGPSSRLTQERLPAIVESVIATARSISADLGYEDGSE